MATLVASAVVLLAATATPVRAESAAEWIERAHAHRERGEIEEAAQALRRAWELGPRDPGLRRALVEALLEVGERRLQQGEDRAALEPLALAVDLAPEQPAVRFALAVAYFRLGESERARVAALAVLEREPAHPGALELLGRLEYAAGRLEEAIFRLEAALAADPQAAGARRLLERARRDLELERAMGMRVSQHFELRFEGGEAEAAAVARAVDDLEAAHAEVGAALGLYPSGRLPVILYADRSFRVATGAHGWVAALYDGKIRVPLEGLLERDQATLRRVLVHEYVHAVVHATAPGCPGWLHEGLAQLLAGEAGDEALVQRAAAAGALVGFAELERGFAGIAERGRAALLYAQSLSFVRWLAARGGTAALGTVIRDLGRGSSLDEALRASFGATLPELERAWREGLGAS